MKDVTNLVLYEDDGPLVVSIQTWTEMGFFVWFVVFILELKPVLRGVMPFDPLFELYFSFIGESVSHFLTVLS